MSAQHFCRRCKYYDPYYTCELRHFKKTQFGWCSQKRKIVPSREGCGAYATRAPQCYGEELTRVALNGILNELAEIRSTMEERSHETEETDVQHLRGI